MSEVRVASWDCALKPEGMFAPGEMSCQTSSWLGGIIERPRHSYLVLRYVAPHGCDKYAGTCVSETSLYTFENFLSKGKGKSGGGWLVIIMKVIFPSLALWFLKGNLVISRGAI